MVNWLSTYPHKLCFIIIICGSQHFLRVTHPSMIILISDPRSWPSGCGNGFHTSTTSQYNPNTKHFLPSDHSNFSPKVGENWKETKNLASRRRRRTTTTTTTIKFKIGLWTSKLGNSYMEVPGDSRGSNGFNRRSSSTLHRHLSRTQIYIYIGRKKRLSMESLFSAAQRSRTPLLKHNKIHCTRPTFFFLATPLGSRLVWRTGEIEIGFIFKYAW